MEDEKDKGGRPPKYKEEYNEMARKLCLLGYTDKRLAAFFEIAQSTLHKWKHDFPEFSEFIKKGKEIADANVVEGLYKRATGCTVKKVKFATFEGTITDEREYMEELPPDVGAAKTWLVNRQPEVWRDKQDIQHSTLDDDGEETGIDLTVLDTKTLEAILAASKDN